MVVVVEEEGQGRDGLVCGLDPLCGAFETPQRVREPRDPCRRYGRLQLLKRRLLQPFSPALDEYPYSL